MPESPYLCRASTHWRWQPVIKLWEGIQRSQTAKGTSDATMIGMMPPELYDAGVDPARLDVLIKLGKWADLLLLKQTVRDIYRSLESGRFRQWFWGQMTASKTIFAPCCETELELLGNSCSFGTIINIKIRSGSHTQPFSGRICSDICSFICLSLKIIWPIDQQLIYKNTDKSGYTHITTQGTGHIIKVGTLQQFRTPEQWAFTLVIDQKLFTRINSWNMEDTNVLRIRQEWWMGKSRLCHCLIWIVWQRAQSSEMFQ